MKTTTSNTIHEYSFEDSKRQIPAVIAGNLIPAIVLLLFNKQLFLHNPHAMLSLISAIFIGLAYMTYNWRMPVFNLTIAGIYLLFVFIEFLLFGIPGPVLKISSSVSKGIFMELILYHIPYVYVGVRCCLLLLLVGVYRKSIRLNREQSQ